MNLEKNVEAHLIFCPAMHQRAFVWSGLKAN